MVLFRAGFNFAENHVGAIPSEASLEVGAFTWGRSPYSPNIAQALLRPRFAAKDLLKDYGDISAVPLIHRIRQCQPLPMNLTNRRTNLLPTTVCGRDLDGPMA